jgi:polyisoprenoid-binding protein YceI
METGTQKSMTSVRFEADKRASRFTVQALATGVLAAFGHSPRIEIRDYDAEIRCHPESFENASLRVTIQTGSMEVLDEMKPGDRQKLEQEMYENVLESRTFPIAEYKSNAVRVQKVTTGLFRAEVNGELLFHGVTQPLLLQGNVTVMGSTLRIAGEFSLRQSDYGITPASFAAGTLRLRDELKFTFDLVARQEETNKSGG